MITDINSEDRLVQRNHEYYEFIHDGVPVEWWDSNGETRYAHVQVIDFRNVGLPLKARH